MNRKTDALIALLLLGTAGRFAELYHEAMYPESPVPDFTKKRIACIGDSITYGSGLMGAFRNNCYPSLLQNLLGAQYQVLNYGFCDRTLQDEADKPYRHEQMYVEAIRCKPETIIFMLGTNDAKPHNWDSGRFKRDLLSFLSDFQKLSPLPRIILMQPPRVFSVMGITLDHIMDSVIKSEVREAIAYAGEISGCQVLDLYSLTENHPEWYADGVHLNRTGAYAVAKAVYSVL